VNASKPALSLDLDDYVFLYLQDDQAGYKLRTPHDLNQATL
jgi:hypothetical protein